MARKQVEMKVVVTVPGWMTAAAARREVRSMMATGVGYLSHGPNFEEIEVNVRSVQPTKATVTMHGHTHVMQRRCR